MLKPNSMYTEATRALMAVLNAENPTKEEVQGAFEQFCGSIAASVQADYESAHGDREVLARRGFRQLTSEETRFYQAVIEAGKSKNPVQVYAGLLDDKVMPTTVIEDVYRDLQEEHPLLAEINFVSVQYLTRWVLNDHTVQTDHQADRVRVPCCRGCSVQAERIHRDREGYAGSRPAVPG